MATLTELQMQQQELFGKQPPTQEDLNPDTDKNNLDDAALKKYRDMASTRGDYSMIDPSRFQTPLMGEMLEEDLMYSIYKKIESEIKDDPTEDDILSRAFYSEAPVSTELGFHADKNVFIIKFSEIKQNDNEWKLNAIDGDTVSIQLSKIDDGGTGFTINNESYSSFKDYCNKLGKGIGGSEITLRFAGINTPEIPHLSAHPVIEKNLVKLKYEEVRKNADKNKIFNYLKYPITKDNKDVVNVWDADFEEMSTWKARSRNDSDEMLFYYIENKDKKTITYYEVLENFTPNTKNLPDVPKGMVYKAIVSSDDTTKNNVVAGYRAKRKVKEKLEKVQDKELYAMINAAGVEPRKTTKKNNIAFNNWWYTVQNIEDLVEEWGKTISDIGQTGFSYNAYGMDTYGRFLSSIYIKEKVKTEKGDFTETWINLAKYLLADEDTMTEGQPDYTGSPELNEAANGLSDAFNLWSYNKNNIKWLDSFENMTNSSYNDKIKFHKEIVGYDFTKSRDCAVMIGDTLLLIPPQSIRNISHNSYEKIPTMRGKGSMVKANSNREHMLELELFFYNENGINGIPKEVTLPNGQKTTYYMNGLRGLVSQFKIAPFLPIENGYINDVLGIEAVTLMNLYIETVEGYPRLLKAVLSLRDFNYRVFMPEVPIDDKEYTENESSKILSEMNPMFAKCFEWELFRYYYQRALQQGENLKYIKDNLGFDSYNYSEYFYATKNSLQPIGMCSSKIGFYIPDKTWLGEALLVKKDRDANRYNILAPELTDNALKYLKGLSNLSTYISEIESGNNTVFNTAVSYFSDYQNINEGKSIVLKQTTKDEKIHKDILKSKQTCIELRRKDGNKEHSIKNKDVVDGYLSPIFSPMISDMLKINGISTITVDEIAPSTETKTDGAHVVKWRFNIKLDLTDLSANDLDAIKETLSLAIGKENDGTNFTTGDIFKDDMLQIDLTASFNPEDYQLYKDAKVLSFTSTVDYLSVKTIGNQFDDAEDNEDTDTSYNEHNQELAFNVQDYKNPANMPFNPYVTDIQVNRLSVSLGNYFTEVSLKAVDGQAPQYMGGQDTQIELELLTDDKLVVSAINTLPSLAIDYTKDYKKIMSCWPLKVENELLQLMGVCEVLIDNIEISTVEGFPNLYSIVMRLTSVDRTQRQREALRKLDTASNAGYLGSNNNKSNLSIKSFYALDETLSKAELYPDLDIPTIEELSQKGYRFIKYSGKDRIYPDPDFYIVYSFPYTAMVIKDMIDKFLEEQVFNPEATSKLNQIDLIDQNGLQLSKKIATTLGVETTSENELSKTYRDIVQSADKVLKEEEYETLTSNQEKLIEQQNELSYILTYLTACDIQEGWEIKPGWVAPLCTHYTNEALENMQSDSAEKEDKDNSYAKEIHKLRQDAIKLINNILSKPINYTPTIDTSYSHAGDSGYNSQSGSIMSQITSAVERLFLKNEDGKKLFELLCPIKDSRSNSVSASTTFPDDKKYFKKADFLRYLAGFTYAAGCVATGDHPYSSTLKDKDWMPNQFRKKEDGSFVCAIDKDGKEYDGIPMSMVKVDHNGSKYSNSGWERDFEFCRDWGIEFGAFGIKRHSSQEISLMMSPSFDTVTYLTDKGEYMYTDSEGKRRYQAGFVDPYYNYAGWRSQEGIKYKHAIMTNASVGAEAFLRVMLTHLKRMILDGFFFSELDIISKDFDSILSTMVNANKIIDEYNDSQALLADANKEKFVTPIIDENNMSELLKSMPETFAKSFCSRMIYPFLSAVTENHDMYKELINNRNYISLNTLTGSKTPTSTGDTPIDKFLRACSGMYMFERDSSKKGDDVSDSQKVINNLMKDVYIQASEDPRLYVMHSFYDMLMNDKRGRLVRAFPTYYMVFMDEGRKIGSWKLHDNFYNMSAISEIQVVKSRKIAADTCRIVMSNMYSSYAQDPDIETTQQYVDVYGLRDVFDSIFSPTSYFEKEEMIRKRMTTPDKVVLQPGIRIHVRMGYTADGAKLPIVFNGKIAEVGVEDVVEIIAQGDGHELMNPLIAFGSLEATALQEAQKKISAFKDLRGNLARGGETPRDLLALVLSAKHGGLIKNMANEWFDGRWFNDNPFGIMHFGDSKMSEIFEQGEVVQNLYEVTDSSLLKGVNELYSSYDNKNASPTINTSIQDKTFWDLLHMAANSGIDYCGAIRDFGMRSTVFLGKPNHYYAYAYTKLDGKLIEKRKPFQQYHHYDSYTDIVYNSIKATEADMKTNAMGIWQSTDALWGREQSTVGPIYLDMNIYPEYQKSMTVDTGLLAAGNGGIDIPFLNHFSEKWAINANDDKVNKELAWRMTMNVLRQSVKDMYQGELCVIGDPTIKPYDRFFITDSYEDMEGQMEVEAVVYSMNADTGFTTTIIPDVIVRHNDPHEVARQSLFSSFATMAKITVSTRLLLINTLASVDNKLIRAIAKSDTLHGLLNKSGKTASQLSTSVGLTKYADSNPALGRLLNKISTVSGTSASEVNILKYTSLIDELGELAFDARLSLDKADDLADLAKILSKIGDLDIDEYAESINKIYSKNKNYLHLTDNVIKETVTNVGKGADEILKTFSNAYKTDLLGNDGVVSAINTYMNNAGIKQSDEVKNAIKAIKDGKGSATKHLGTILSDKEVSKIVTSNKYIADKLTHYVDGVEDLFKGAKGANKISSLKTLLKNDNVIDSLKAVFKTGLRLNLGTIAVEIVKTAFITIIANNANEFLTRWIKSIQALTVYPINKNGRVLVAGMNGHKGSVFGAPPSDAYESIQGMIMKSKEYFEKSIPLIGGFIVDELVNKEVYEQTVEQWKINLGMTDQEDINIKREQFNQQVYDQISNELSSRMKTAHALKTRARIDQLSKTDEANKVCKSHQTLKVKLEDLGNNKKLSQMVYLKDDLDILKAITDKSSYGVQLSLAHDEGNGNITIRFEDGVRNIQFISKDNIYDLPIVQEECIYIINRLLNQQELKNKVIHFMTGIRINDSTAWNSTGYAFTLECKEINTLSTVLKKIKEETAWTISKDKTQYLFDYKVKENKVSIVAYAPKQ